MKEPSSNGKIVVITAVNPATVCCPEALLVSGLFSLGVRQHPRFPFEIVGDEIKGQTRTRWRWTLRGESENGQYKTRQLIKWWHDQAWLAANPAHDLAQVRNVVMNVGEVAKGVRDSVPFAELKKGDLIVRIPANASPARRAFLIDVFEGRRSPDENFVEPAGV